MKRLSQTSLSEPDSNRLQFRDDIRYIKEIKRIASELNVDVSVVVRACIRIGFDYPTEIEYEALRLFEERL